MQLFFTGENNKPIETLNYDDEKLIYTFTNLLKQYFGKLGITAIKISPLILKNIYDFSSGKADELVSYEVVDTGDTFQGYSFNIIQKRASKI